MSHVLILRIPSVKTDQNAKRESRVLILLNMPACGERKGGGQKEGGEG